MRPRLALATWACAVPLVAQTYRISGTVINAVTGAPVGRIRMGISPTSERTRTQYVTTASNGRFAFQNLAAGKWSLAAQRTGFGYQAFGQPPSLDAPGVAIVTGPDQSTDDLVFRLHPSAMIVGKIIDHHGDPVSNALVQVMGWTVAGGRRRVQPFRSCWSNGDGTYAVGSLPAGSYFVAVTAEPWYGGRLRTADGPAAFAPHFYPSTIDPRASTPIVLRSGEEATADFTLTPTQAVTVRLRSRQLKPVRLELRSDGVAGAALRYRTPSAPSPYYTFRLIPGRYTLWLWTGDDVQPGIQTLQIGQTDVDLDLQPDEPANLEARIHALALAPEALATLGLVLFREDDGYSVPRMIARDGLLKFPPMPAGRYRLRLTGRAARDAYIESVSAEGAVFANGILEFGSGANVRLRVVLSGHAGRLEGTVCRGGRPLSGVFVVLSRHTPSDDPANYRAFVTDSDGSFEFDALRPGDYAIFAVQDDTAVEYANPAIIRPYLESARQVQLQPRGSVNLRLDLPDPRQDRK